VLALDAFVQGRRCGRASGFPLPQRFLLDPHPQHAQKWCVAAGPRFSFKASSMTIITKPVVWQPDRRPQSPDWAKGAEVPGLVTMMLRGALGQCPCCGAGRLFAGYLRQAPACSSCDVELAEVRADDAPPYFTMLLVGHIVVPLMLLLEKARSPELWVHAAIFLPMTCVLTLGLLRPIKGATIGLMLRLNLLKQPGNA
jgi:uncharacterized protein (DUF983 family)